MNNQITQKFIVVSYDDDQQQWFWDYVVSRTEQNAVALVCKRRPYVIAADAASLSQNPDYGERFVQSFVFSNQPAVQVGHHHRRQKEDQ